VGRCYNTSGTHGKKAVWSIASRQWAGVDVVGDVVPGDGAQFRDGSWQRRQKQGRDVLLLLLGRVVGLHANHTEHIELVARQQFQRRRDADQSNDGPLPRSVVDEERRVDVEEEERRLAEVVPVDWRAPDGTERQRRQSPVKRRHVQ